MEGIVQQARREVGKVLREAGYEKEFKIEMKACISRSKKTRTSQAFGELTRHCPWVERSLQSPIDLPGEYISAHTFAEKVPTSFRSGTNTEFEKNPEVGCDNNIAHP